MKAVNAQYSIRQHTSRDPTIHDDKYDATVLGWAEYCVQPAIAALLREQGITYLLNAFMAVTSAGVPPKR